MGGALAADDVARAVLFVYQQPQSVCIREIAGAPTKQQPKLIKSAIKPYTQTTWRCG